MPGFSSRRTTIGLAALLLALGGCSLSPREDPSQFYLLTAAADSLPAEDAEEAQEVTIGVGPVRFPDYLDRPQMITRISEVQVVVSEFERWAESPKSNFTAVLARDLALELETMQIVAFPWVARVDYSVQVNVQRFERDSAGTAELRCRWVILDRDRNAVLRRQAAYREVAADASTDAAVAALSRTVHRLSVDIAAALRQLPTD